MGFQGDAQDRKFMRRISLVLLPLLALIVPAALRAQEPEGVRLGLLYQSEYQPGLVVLPIAAPGELARAAGTIQTVLRQDLDYSDRFQIRTGTEGVKAGDSVNLKLWKQRGADWVVDGTLAPRSGGVALRLVLHDAVYGQTKGDQVFLLPPDGDPGFRMAVHAAADEVVRWATGTPGAAASRIAFVLQGRGSREIYLVDSDGENVQRVTSDGSLAVSPAWSPDGTKLAYTSFRTGRPILYERDLRTGRDRVLSDRDGLNITPSYSPDGKLLAFATTAAGNTEVVTEERSGGPLRQQTHGRQYESLAPSFSPDGSQFAFVSNRLGEPAIYVMSLGGDARLVSEYTYGKSGYNTSPDWSPKGSEIAYHSRMNGIHQIVLVDVAKGTRRLLTNEGNNEDPSWGPDGRHLVFSSRDRDGGGLFVLDTVSGRVRPLLRGAGYGLPDWSGTLFRAQSIARAPSGGQ
jgi:TolB protein